MLNFFYQRTHFITDEAFTLLASDNIQVSPQIIKKAKKGDGEALYTIGRLYFDKENYPRALSWYGKSALQNYPHAFNDIGYMYQRGLGLPVNGQRALDYYLKSGDNSFAQTQIGLLYQNGVGGVEENKKLAMDYYLKATNGTGKSVPIAQNYIGELYENGYNDVELAKQWYLKAAQHGNAKAQDNIGRLYQFGLGVTMDNDEALRWYNKAAQNGYAAAYKHIEKIKQAGRGISDRMRECFASAANGDFHAMNCIGELYMTGDAGVAQNYDKAMDWYLKADRGNNHFAQNHIGEMYMNGLGVVKDDCIAFEWFLKAAKNGNVFAQNHVGEFYTAGRGGMPQNYTLAREWFEKAVDNQFAENHLGEFYQEGLGVPKNEHLAMVWYLRAAEKGNRFSMNHIGDFYHYGLGGTPKNILTAIEWYEKSADQGFVIAQYNLALVYENEEKAKDIAKAFYFYQKAVDKGHKEAKNALERLKKEKEPVKENNGNDSFIHTERK